MLMLKINYAFPFVRNEIRLLSGPQPSLMNRYTKYIPTILDKWELFPVQTEVEYVDSIDYEGTNVRKLLLFFDCLLELDKINKCCCLNQSRQQILGKSVGDGRGLVCLIRSLDNYLILWYVNYIIFSAQQASKSPCIRSIHIFCVVLTIGIKYSHWNLEYSKTLLIDNSNIKTISLSRPIIY